MLFLTFNYKKSFRRIKLFNQFFTFIKNFNSFNKIPQFNKHTSFIKKAIELFDLERNEYHIKKSSNLLGYNLNCNSFSLISLHNTKQYLIGYLTGSSSFIKIISFSDFQLNNNIVNSIQQTMITTDSKAIN